MSGYPRPRTVRRDPGCGDLAAVAACAGDRPAAAGDVAVTGITHDSAAVRPGDLYAALPGARRHGARVRRRAAAAGAVAVLTDPAGAGWLAGRGLPALRGRRPAGGARRRSPPPSTATRRRG